MLSQAGQANGGGSHYLLPQSRALWGIRLPWNVDNNPIFSFPVEYLNHLLLRLNTSAAPPEIKHVLVQMLGPESFTLGAFLKIKDLMPAEVTGAQAIAELIRTFALADMEEIARGRGTARSRTPQSGEGGGLAQYISTADLERVGGGERLRYAHQRRTELINEIKTLFETMEHRSMVVALIPIYERFATHASDISLPSQFEAGLVFGGLLLSVLALVENTGPKRDQVFRRMPRLLKLAADTESGRVKA